MNSILVSPRRRGQEPGRILVIESDPERSKTLENVLRGQVRAHFEIVKSMDQAIGSMTAKMPDLVLTSPFLKPADEARLTAYLKQTPAASHVQVITVPHSIETDDDAGRSGTGSVLSFLRRRSAPPSACAPDTLRTQIEAYLVQARVARTRPLSQRFELVAPSANQDQSETQLVLVRSASEFRPLSRESGATTPSVVRRPHVPGGGDVTDRRRARRRPAADLPGLWAVRLPLGPEAKVVDISSTGVLVETSFKLKPGSTLDLQVLGQNIDIRVPARLVRSEVGSVDRLGVKYRAAAVFSHEVDIAGLHVAHSDPSLMPKVLAEMLGRVLADVDHSARGSSLRTRFEDELRRLLPVREIKIRQTPVVPAEQAESVYFTVPRTSGARPILQAIFEPDYEPSAMDFRLMKAAAGVAAVILEFAPLRDEVHPPAAELVMS